MRQFLVTALAGALLLSACSNADGTTNWGNTLGLGLGVLAAGAGTYYVAKQAAKNRDDGADYCSQRYTGRALRQCINSLPGR
jgi:hypothetical protein